MDYRKLVIDGKEVKTLYVDGVKVWEKVENVPLQTSKTVKKTTVKKSSN